MATFGAVITSIWNFLNIKTVIFELFWTFIILIDRNLIAKIGDLD